MRININKKTISSFKGLISEDINPCKVKNLSTHKKKSNHRGGKIFLRFPHKSPTIFHALLVRKFLHFDSFLFPVGFDSAPLSRQGGRY